MFSASPSCLGCLQDGGRLAGDMSGGTERRLGAAMLMPCALLLFVESAFGEIEPSSLAAWNTMRTPESETLDWYTRHSRRRLLVSARSCACVCAGTHEGYVQVRYFLTYLGYLDSVL